MVNLADVAEAFKAASLALELSGTEHGDLLAVLGTMPEEQRNEFPLNRSFS